MHAIYIVPEFRPSLVLGKVLATAVSSGLSAARGYHPGVKPDFVEMLLRLLST